MTDDYLNEALQYFLIDSKEEIDQINNDLVDLEQRPNDEELVARIFRSMHTMKGTGGCLGFDVVGRLAHLGENLLHKVREGKIAVTSELISLLLETTDILKNIIAQIEETGADTNADIKDISDRLDQFEIMATSEAENAPTPEAPTASSETNESTLTLSENQLEMIEKVTPRIGDILIELGYVTQQDVFKAIGQQTRGDPRHLGEILVENGVIEPNTVREILNIQDQRKIQATKTEGSIRVNVQHLDHLMNLIGELVLTRNQLTQYVEIHDDTPGNSIAHRLNHITGELQEAVMKTRLQPLQTVLGNFPRVVRDLSISCGKQVHLEIEGEKTELDRSIIEAIRDPLTHLVRNAVDHGIESPADRTASSKPAQGLLSVRASHTGSQVVIEISDDGAGINAEKIKQRAIEKKIIRAEVAAQLSDRAALDLIFEPGFSTAETISDISGRGVGMDVVKNNLEKIGGLVDISTVEGAGTNFRMKIPLTLAIVPAVIIETCGARFALPQTHVVELFKHHNILEKKQIECIHDTPVFRLRGRLVPLVDLGKILNLRDDIPNFWTDESLHDQSKLILIKSDNRMIGLRVDKVWDTEEIVVKSLNRHVQNIPVFSGATISGDGKVVLILDAMGIAKYANAVPESNDEIYVEEVEEFDQILSDEQLLLICHNADGGQLAFPITEVLRLEKIHRDKFTETGETTVIQYGDEIMPLIYVPSVLPERRKEARAVTLTPLHNLRRGLSDIPVIIHRFHDRHVGLIVDHIDDIVADLGEARGAPSREFVSYTALISDKITEVIDIPEIIHQHVDQRK